MPATKHLTDEERRCEEHFKSTTRRSPEGRFIVKLPFKNEIGELGDSQQQARRRLRSLLHRLQKQPDLYRRYNEFINAFIKLGHMEEVPAKEMLLPIEKSYYLSHHCVFKDSSTTTKLRVVFDGSAKTTSGISLNDRLMVGPKIQKDLFSILIRFRMYPVALSADIAKMYRQVQLDTEDKDYHRLLEPNSTDIKTFRMTRVTYGIASSAFHSIRPLQVLAEDVTDKNVQLGITTDMYVDDLLTGAPDLESAMKLQDSIVAVLSKAGLEIRKWTSSNPELVERLPANIRETTDEMTIKSDDYSIKTLGVKWNPNPDHFSFIAKLDEKTPSTKREILSEVTRLFDPLGWLSPTTIQFKSFVQLLWMDRFGWDEALSKCLQQQYSRLRVQLTELETITLPRKVVSISPASSDIELHVFCDASTTAYAALVYIRQSFDGTVHTRMLTAKTRVAPIRSLCVPRLELCAALLGANLVEAISSSLNDQRFPTPKVYAWTDSTVTLAWLQDFPRKWKTFVANRVAKIQNLIPSSNWNFVPTEENPADCASRGISAANLAKYSLWWNGPSWLEKSEDYWPKSESIEEHQHAVNNEVQGETLKQTTMVVTQENNSIVQLIHRTSSFGKLVRISCYVKKFIQKAKQQSQKTIASRTDPTKSDTKCYSQKRNLSSKRCQQKKSEAAIASEFQSLQLSSSDLYLGRIAIYSLIQKLYLQEFDAIVSQSSSSMTEGKGNNIPENLYCHKPLGKVEVGKVGEVEVGKVEVGKVKVGKVGQGEVSKVVEVGKGGRVEVGKIGKVQVGKLCTAQLGVSDKPTRFNDLQQQVGTSEEELINSTSNFLPSTTQTIKLFAWADD